MERLQGKGKHVSKILVLVVVLFAGPITALVNAEQKTQNVIRVKGSTLMANMVNELAKDYEKIDPKTVIIVSGGGSTAGFKDFLVRNVELVLATREMTSEEKKIAQTNGMTPAQLVIGWGCVTIIAHPTNPVSELTLAQVKEIFTGKITSWKQVGGPEKAIEFYLPDPNRHGTHLFFQKAVLDGEPYGSAARVESDYDPLIRRVANNEAAIAYCILNKTLQSLARIKVLSIKKDQNSPAVAPSWKTAEDRTYPIARPLYLVWDEANVTPPLKQFVEFCVKQGLRRD